MFIIIFQSLSLSRFIIPFNKKPLYLPPGRTYLKATSQKQHSKKNIQGYPDKPHLNGEKVGISLHYQIRFSTIIPHTGSRLF